MNGTPKPRAEGSSPSAPAINFWLRKAISEAFSLLILPKILPSLCDVQIDGAVESVNRRFLCGLAAVDINSLGGVYAFVSEQNGNVLNRYAVVVEDTRNAVPKSVDRTMRQAGVFGQTVNHPIDCAEVDIWLSENGADNEVVTFVVAVAKQLGIILLTLLFGFQLSDYKIVYRDFAVTALCLWRGDLHCHVLAAACSALVDVQELFVIIYILPRQGEQFALSQPCIEGKKQKYVDMALVFLCEKQELPDLLCVVFGNVLLDAVRK